MRRLAVCAALLVLAGSAGVLEAGVAAAHVEQSAPPVAPTLVSPRGTSSPADPTFTWNAVSDATQYYVWINDSTGKRFDKWYTREAVGCPSGTGTCSLAPYTPLNAGTITWWVQASSAAGTGPWSAAATFTLQPLSTPTLIGPTGYTPKPSYQFRWNAVPGATYHYLRVIDSAGTTRVQTWYTTAASNCASGGVCSVTVSPTLSAGTATWSVQPWNATVGYGTWSAGMTFTPVDPLATPTLIAPTGSYTGMPSVQFRWNAVSGATHYYLWVNDGAGVTRVQTWYTTAATNCASGSVCSITLSPTLSPGTAAWWIQAKNAQITSPWSAAMTFTPNVPLATPTLIAPTGSYTGMPSVTFRWNAVQGATEHYLWLNDATGTDRVRAWYDLASTGCSTGGVCSLTVSPSLSPGAATWWIQARNATVTSPWSVAVQFTPDVPLATPTLTAPTGMYTALPTVQFQWPAVAGASEHALRVTDGSGTVTIDTWYPLAATGCAGGGTCSITLSPTLTAGEARWSIQARNATVTSAVSAPMAFTPVVTPPTLSVAAGTYQTSQTVVIASSYTGATTRYTTTGEDPIDTDQTVPANGQVAVDRSVNLCARTWVSGNAPSVVTCRSYTLQLQTPTMTPGAGTYTAAQAVSLSTPTPGAAVRYTTDGSEPTETSPLASGPVTIDGSRTVKAAAFKDGWSTSATTSAVYELNFGTLATPSISPAPGTFVHGQSITIEGPSGATVRYTTDGTTPLEASTEYTGPLTLSSSMTVSARAFRTDWTPSATATAAYQAVVPTPTVSVASGTYSDEFTVTVATTTPNSTIRYTTSGNDPSESDATIPANGHLLIDHSTTLRVRAWATNHLPSDVRSASYTLQAAAPLMTPSGGGYLSAQTVMIASATPNVVIRYTVDGTEPSETSAPYVAPIEITTSTTLKARAFRTAWTASGSSTAQYSLNYGTLATPAIAPVSGTYDYGHQISVTGPDDATIRYTVDGNSPTATSPAYSAPLRLTSSMTMLARAFKDDWTPSATASATFEAHLPAPVVDRPSGVYPPEQTVTVTVPVPIDIQTPGGLVVRYTLNGDDPTESSELIVLSGEAIAVGNFTLKLRAFAPNVVPSAVTVRTYELEPCTYSVQPAAVTLGADAGSGSIALTTNRANCPWTVMSGASWLTFETTSGVGSAQLSYHAAQNGSASARVATVSIEGLSLPFTQTGTSCHATPSSNAISMGSAPFRHEVPVTAEPHCEWRLAVTAPWLTVAMLNNTAYSDAVLADEPIAYWRLDDASGDETAADVTGLGHSGHRRSGVAFGAVGALGDVSTSADFTANGTIEIPHSPAFEATAFTWEAWVNVPRMRAYPRRLIAKGVANQPFALMIDGNSRKPTFSWTLAGMGTQKATLDTDVVGVGWIHLAFTSDGVIWRAFVDGSERRSGTLGGTLITNAESVTLGDGALPLDGQLDEVAVYSAALSRDRIAAHYSIVRHAEGSGSFVLVARANLSGQARLATISAGDASITVTQSAHIRSTNTPPSVDDIYHPAFPVGVPFHYALPAADADNDPLTFTAANLPSWLRLDSSSGILFGTPPSTGGHGFTVVVSDGYGGSSSTVVTLRVVTPEIGALAIQARVFPAPNAAGWNNSNVVVRFECIAASVCPGPITVNEETQGRTISGTALNSQGEAVTTSVVIKLDKTSPHIMLSEIPPARTELDTVTIAGIVSDTSSGIRIAACNGTNAPVDNSTLSCHVSLRPGRNPILVHAIDVAGNSESVSVFIEYGTATTPEPTSLVLLPNDLTLRVGEDARLQAIDNFARDVSATTFTTSDGSVATVSPEGLVTAIAPGSVTIIATSNGLTAEMSVTVSLSVVLPSGVVRWRATPAANHSVSHVITGLPESSGDLIEGNDGDTQYVVEQAEGVGDTIVKAFHANGRLSWSARAPIAATEYVVSGIGHATGGLLLTIVDEGGTFGLLRLLPGGAGGWRRTNTGGVIGQASDGTIFTANGDGTSSAWISVYEGSSGTSIARVPLARSTVVWSSSGSACGWGTSDWITEGGLHGPTVIDANGTAHLFVSSYYAVGRSEQVHIEVCNDVTQFFDGQLELWSISSDGALAKTHVADTSVGMVATGSGLVPDGSGALLMSWGTETFGDSPAFTGYLGRRSSGGPVSTLASSADGILPVAMGETNTVFVHDGNGVTARDATSGTPRWSIPAGSIVGTTQGGGVAVQRNGMLTVYDGEGAPVDEGIVPEGVRPAGSRRWVASSQSGVVMTAGPALSWSASGFNMPGGSILGGQAAANCGPPTEDSSMVTLSTPRDYLFTFSHEGIGFADPLRQLTMEAANEWKFGGDRGYPGLIEEAGVMRIPTLVMKRADLSHLDAPGEPTGGSSNRPDHLYRYEPELLARIKQTRAQNLPPGVTPVPGDMFGIVLNGNLETDTEYGRNYHKFLVMHEFGHSLGLHHPITTGCTGGETVMARRFYGQPIVNVTPTVLDRERLRRLLGIQ
jgi:hypothetical protein